MSSPQTDPERAQTLDGTGAQTGSALREAHEQALSDLARGDDRAALGRLRSAIADALDPVALSDLAVLAYQSGERRQAESLLRTALALFPGNADAAKNLSALDAEGAGCERRERFLQVIVESLRARLVDNLDYLCQPWGIDLPDPATYGQRISDELALVEAASTFWNALADDSSRELFLRYFAFRALGPAHVRLQLDPRDYRQAVMSMNAHLMVKAGAGRTAGLPLEWQFHQYDFTAAGFPIQMISAPLQMACTLLFSQYAYRNPATGAGPRAGDVALDVGACWGDTALWLAHVVGPGGHVHSFEPAPQNTELLMQNLSLNPQLAERVTVHESALGPRDHETVWMPDVFAAGATLQHESSGQNLLEMSTITVDSLVQTGAIERVDFIKVDVEGADLGVLEGAARTIREQRPRLALAAYHKPDDLIKIPEFIASLGVPYRWYLQSCKLLDLDTIAFAVAEQ